MVFLNNKKSRKRLQDCREGGLTNERPWSDHVIWGPIRGLEKNCTRWRRQTHGHGDSMTNSAQCGRVGENFKKLFSNWCAQLFCLSANRRFLSLSPLGLPLQQKPLYLKFLLGFQVRKLGGRLPLSKSSLNKMTPGNKLILRHYCFFVACFSITAAAHKLLLLHYCPYPILDTRISSVLLLLRHARTTLPDFWNGLDWRALVED